MPDELRRLADREYATAALILIHEARRDVGQGHLQNADETLAVAERVALMAGAKDIGPLQEGRDLPDDVLNARYRARERVEELEAELDEIKGAVDREEADADD